MTAKNSARNGAQTEREAIRILKSQDYTIHRSIRTPYRRGKDDAWGSNSSDIFGCVDIIAKRPGERTRWIQVTRQRAKGRKEEDLSKVPWNPAVDSVEIWRRVPAGKRIKRPHFCVYHLDSAFSLAGATRIFPHLEEPE